MISAHRFKAIFCHRFGVTFSKDMEKFWGFVSENTPDLYTLTLKKGTLAHCDKRCEGMCPKILLYALDELFHVFRVFFLVFLVLMQMTRANDLNRQCVVAYNILLFALLCCTEQRGKSINPQKTCGDTSTMVDVEDKKGLKLLVMAIYDGVLLPGEPPQLQDRHDWVQIIDSTYRLVFQGEYIIACHAPLHPLMLSRP